MSEISNVDYERIVDRVHRVLAVFSEDTRSQGWFIDSTDYRWIVLYNSSLEHLSAIGERILALKGKSEEVDLGYLTFTPKRRFKYQPEIKVVDGSFDFERLARELEDRRIGENPHLLYVLLDPDSRVNGSTPYDHSYIINVGSLLEV